MKDAPLFDLLRKPSIKDENQLMSFSDFIWKTCLDTGRTIVEYMIFYQGGTIEHGTHVPGTISQSCS